MKEKFELRCYKKGCTIPDNNIIDELFKDYVILSIWQSRKDRFFIMVEGIFNGRKCFLRTKNLLEAIAVMKEIFDKLIQPSFKTLDKETKNVYDNSRPSNPMNLIRSKNCTRMETERGLVNYNEPRSTETALVLMNIGCYESFKKNVEAIL